MNVFVIILLSFSLVDGFDYKRRCLFFKNSCVPRCPRNMHPYHTRCDKDTISQRTCRSPYTFAIGYTCGWSRCDCDNNMVLSEVTWQCMEIEKCAVIKKRKRSRRRGPRRKNKLPKNIVIEDGDLIDVGNADLEPGILDKEMEDRHGQVAAKQGLDTFR